MSEAAKVAEEKVRRLAITRKALKNEREELLEWVKAADRTHSKNVRKRIGDYFDDLEARIREVEKAQRH